MKTRLSLAVLLGLMLLCAAQASYAQCVGFSGEELVADGVPRAMFIGGNATVTYFFNVLPDRSYSLQITTPDPESTGIVTDATLARCGGPEGTSRDTSRLDPPLLSNTSGNFEIFSGRRISFIPTTIIPGGIGFNFHNTDVNAHNFQAVLVDTTLFNPLWSTFSGFETFYRIQNATNSACTVTLSLKNDAGALMGLPRTVTVPGNSTFATLHTGPGTFPPAMSVGNDQAGGATFTHDCPPGAVQVDGFLGRFDLAAPVVLPIKIVAARETR